MRTPIAFLALLLLAACGGGGSEPAPETPKAPAGGFLVTAQNGETAIVPSAATVPPDCADRFFAHHLGLLLGLPASNATGCVMHPTCGDPWGVCASEAAAVNNPQLVVHAGIDHPYAPAIFSAVNAWNAALNRQQFVVSP